MSACWQGESCRLLCVCQGTGLVVSNSPSGTKEEGLQRFRGYSNVPPANTQLPLATINLPAFGSSSEIQARGSRFIAEIDYPECLAHGKRGYSGTAAEYKGALKDS